MMDFKMKNATINENCGKRENQRYIGNNKKGRLLAITMVLTLLAGLIMAPGGVDQVFAAENTDVKITQTGGYFAVAGDTGVNVTMRVDNKGKSPVTFSAKTGLNKTDGALTEPNPSSSKITLEPGNYTDILFMINVSKVAKVDAYRIPVILTDDKDGSILRSRDLEINIIKKTTVPGADENGNIVYTPAMDLVHKLSPSDAIVGGTTTNLSLSFVNSGNTTMKNAIITLGLPDGITVNNGSNSLSVGYVDIGSSKTVTFPLIANDKVETKNYPFTIKIEFKDYSNADRSIEQTLYIPVKGSKSSTSLSGVSITDINMPKQVLSGEDFTLSFKVANSGDSGTGQVKISTEVQSGLVNRTQNAFIESNIAAGGSKNYSVTFFSPEKTEETSYTIKLLVEPISGEGSGVQQYTAVYVKKVAEDSDSIKTPQLMVSSYSYGGTYVHAGDEFRLDLELRNTSSAHNLRNIKATVESADGTFIPVQSSNSFFINEIGKNSSAGHTMYLSVKPDAEQKTTSLNIAMTYEDLAGNAFTSNDVISIPVMQDTRLLVDDIVGPPEIYMGMQNGASVDFYNMGRTKLHNLRITAEGNFDSMESNSYFVGNMEPGSTDSYDFSFMPREEGTLSGKVIFTYEDASGDQQVYEKEFEFQVMGTPPWEEPWMPEEPIDEGKSIPWIPIAIGLAVLAVAGFIIFRKLRKKKMQREMEINE